MGLSVYWIVLLQLSAAFSHGFRDDGFDGWYQPVPHRPVDIITDVINDLGVRILQQYTGHGNVAFSPTGVGFVLVALYEGSAGRGSQQISDALGLPRDRDITRIGFRDIHRRLRTYLNADGFLGGLTLNRENTILRPEYEDVLRFYGFDLSNIEEETNQTEATPMPETTTTSATSDGPTTERATIVPMDETTTPATTAQLTNAEDLSTENEGTSTTTSPVELLETTLNTPNLRDRLTQTASTADSTILTEMFTETTTRVTPNSITTGTSPSMESTSTTISPQTLPTIVPEITTVPSSNTESTIATNDSGTTILVNDITDETTVIDSTTITNPATTTFTSQSINPNGQTTDSANTEGTIGTTELPESMTTSPTNVAVEETSTMLSTDASMDAGSIPVTQNPTSSPIPDTTDANGTSAGSTNGPPADENTVSTGLADNETVPMTNMSEIGSTDLPGTTAITGEAVTVSNGQSGIGSSTTDDSMNRVRRRSARSLRGYFSSYPDEGIWMQDLGIWKPYTPGLSEASVRDSTEISFLVNGCDVSSVTAARYIAVLPFAYFPSLHAVALEFPLDDPRYNILLLMATDRRDTYRLARDLGGKSLRLLRKQLQPTWVRATIPSFMLRGFVTLTSFLQRLGILDVFEPRAADLSPMTPDLGVYARDVQQSIGVNIRNYMKPDRTHSRNGLFERAGPVPFTAVQPFLYFIVDAETSVALIAGRVNDPLNSRIL